MKRLNILPVLLLTVFALGTISYHFDALNFVQKQPGEGMYEEKEGESAKGYAEYMFSLRKNPQTGSLTSDDILLGRIQVKEALQLAGSRGGSTLGLEWQSMGPNNVGGRTRALAFDKDNPTRMYAGSVSGGLFISDNAGLEWYPSPANETLEALSITSIAVSADGTIYIGGGESQTGYYTGFGSFTPGFPGNGVYKSTDHGVTFTSLEETVPTPSTIGGEGDWAYINRIACHPTDANKLVVAHNGGISYSLDGGDTWDFATSTTAMSAFVGADAVFDSDGNAHVIYNTRYYKSSSDISVFNQIGSGLPTGGRTLLAVAQSDPNYCYVIATSGSTNELVGIYRSTDGGNNFSAISTAGTSLFFDLNGQGYYNLCIAVNPADKDMVYAGGTYESYKWTAGTGSWTPMSYWAYPEWYPQYIHADQHFFAFRPDNPEIMYFCSDGGISRTLNAMDVTPDFQSMNKGYSTYQCYGVGFGLFGEVVGGSQDNGTQYISFEENSDLQAITFVGGDGGRAEVSRIRPEYLFGAVYFGELRRSVNSGASTGSIFDCNIDKAGGSGSGACNPNGLPDNGAEFVTIFKLWENWNLYSTFKDVLYGGSVEYPAGSGTTYVLNDVVNYEGRDIMLTRSGLSESRLYLAANSNLWMTNGALFNSTEAPTWFKVLPSTLGIVSAIETDNSGDIVYVGTANGRLYRIEGLLGASYEYVDGAWDAASAGITSYLYPETFPVGGSTSRITGISINKDNPDQIVVSTAGYGVDDNIFYSDNALSNDDATFTSIADELPNIPVYGVLLESYSDEHVLAATEFGVWSYNLSTGGAWTQEATNLGGVPVLEIREGFIRDVSCEAIYLGTHGRGFFRSTTLAPGTCDFSLKNDSMAVESPIQEEIIAGIAVSPNPSDNYAEVTLTLTEAATITTKIYAMSGLLVRNYGSSEKTAGTNRYTIDVSGINAGTYLLSFEIDGAVVSKKISII
jgi:hypothetical protein